MMPLKIYFVHLQLYLQWAYAFYSDITNYDNDKSNNNNNEIAKYVYWVSQSGMTSVLALCQGRVEPPGPRQ